MGEVPIVWTRAQGMCSQHTILSLQAARTTFVSPSDPTVVLALDTNIQMMKENPLDVVMEDRHELFPPLDMRESGGLLQQENQQCFPVDPRNDFSSCKGDKSSRASS